MPSAPLGALAGGALFARARVLRAGAVAAGARSSRAQRWASQPRSARSRPGSSRGGSRLRTPPPRRPSCAPFPLPPAAPRARREAASRRSRSCSASRPRIARTVCSSPAWALGGARVERRVAAAIGGPPCAARGGAGGRDRRGAPRGRPRGARGRARLRCRPASTATRRSSGLRALALLRRRAHRAVHRRLRRPPEPSTTGFQACGHGASSAPASPACALAAALAGCAHRPYRSTGLLRRDLGRAGAAAGALLFAFSPLHVHLTRLAFEQRVGRAVHGGGAGGALPA